MFDEILELEGIKTTNVFEVAYHIGEQLDGYDYQFRDLRHKAYLTIARKIDALDEQQYRKE